MMSSMPSPFGSPAVLTDVPEASNSSMPVGAKTLFPVAATVGYRMPSGKMDGKVFDRNDKASPAVARPISTARADDQIGDAIAVDVARCATDDPLVRMQPGRTNPAVPCPPAPRYKLASWKTAGNAGAPKTT